MILALAFLIWIIANPAIAATYYVDFTGGADTNNGTSTSTPWKRIKGMTGVASTAAAATITDGDTVIFKGGVTWTASWPWAIVGGSAAAVTYTTNHAWYSGGAWSQPIMDQEAAGTNYATDAMLTKSGGGYVTINDLKFYRCGVLGVATQAACLYFTNTANMILTNNTFDGRTWFTVYFLFNSAGTYSNFTVTGNDFTNTTSAIWFASAAANAHETNFTYTNNTIHDFASMLGCSTAQGSCAGGGAHGDGFLHYFSSPTNDATQYLDGLTFCNNRSYGDFTRGIGSDANEDMTAIFYQEGAIKNGLLCNNDFGWYPYANSAGTGPIFGYLIELLDYGNTANDTMAIYNNTIGGSFATSSFGAALSLPSTAKAIVKNNIVVSGSYCMYGESGSAPAGLTSDYNEYYCPNGNLFWATDGGHSLTASDPLFASAPSNLHLTTSSPGKAAGVNLSGLGITLLNSDRDSVARGSSWDMGAYEYVPPFMSLTGSMTLTGSVSIQ